MIDEKITPRQELYIFFLVYFENIYIAGHMSGYSKREALILAKSRKIKKYIRENEVKIRDYMNNRFGDSCYYRGHELYGKQNT